MQTVTVRDDVSLYTLFRGNLDLQGRSTARALRIAGSFTGRFMWNLWLTK